MSSGAAAAAASSLALVLSDEPRLLPASELHARLALMEAAAKAYHAELQRRPLSMPAASPRAHPDRVWSGPVGAPPSPNKERRDSLKKVKLHSERV